MYVAAILLTMYNKWMFDPSRSLHIEYPLMVTGFHQTLLWVMAHIFLRSRGLLTPENLNQGDWKYYMKYIIPTAVATAGDIGFGNLSFKYVPFTVYTIVKSSTIAFVLFFGCLFKVETPHWRLFFIVMTMFLGVVLMGYKPVDTSSTPEARSAFKESLGVIFVVISCALGGFRWVYTQVILNHKKNAVVLPLETEELLEDPAPMPRKNPLVTLYQLALPMAVMLFLTSLIVERPIPSMWHSQLMQWDGHSKSMALLRGTGLLVFPSCLVFVLTMCEFGILQVAPVLTLSITGIIKELATVFIGMAVFHETLGFYNWIGMLVVLIDVCYYNYFRYTQRTAFTVPEYRSADSSESTVADIERAWELDSLKAQQQNAKPTTTLHSTQPE